MVFPIHQALLVRLCIPSHAIAEANREVQKVISYSEKKRAPYRRYITGVPADIGKYACQHGVAATAKHFSRKLARVKLNAVKMLSWLLIDHENI